MVVWDRVTLEEGDRDPNAGSDPGGGNQGAPGGGGYAPPSAGSSNVLTRRWIDVKWVYDEPQPPGACTDFEIAIYAGTDVDTGTLACPPILVGNALARRCIYLLELRTKIDLKAAVRACYGEFRSAWVNASTASTFIPDVQQRTDSGMHRFPDGMIMQWRTVGLWTGTTEGTITADWPQPFPNGIYTVSVSPKLDSANNSADTFLQVVSYSQTAVTIQRQGVNSGSGHNMRGLVVGWGY